MKSVALLFLQYVLMNPCAKNYYCLITHHYISGRVGEDSKKGVPEVNIQTEDNFEYSRHHRIVITDKHECECSVGQWD